MAHWGGVGDCEVGQCPVSVGKPCLFCTAVDRPPPYSIGEISMLIEIGYNDNSVPNMSHSDRGGKWTRQN